MIEIQIMKIKKLYLPWAKLLTSPKLDKMLKVKNYTSTKIMIEKENRMNLDPAKIRNNPIKISTQPWFANRKLRSTREHPS